jgi:hypothetical protein
LDPQKDVVYHSGFQVLLGTAGPTLFLAKDVPVKAFGNVSDDLPLRGDEGKNVHFLFFPHSDSALGLLANLYPGGKREIISDAQGKPFAGAFWVSAEEIAANQALWSGSPTGLRRRYYLVPRGRDLLGESDLQVSEAQPERERIDRVLHWRNINGAIEGGERLFAVWEGSLQLREGGAYELDLDTDGAGSIWVDGKLIGGRRVPGSMLRLPATVQLDPGAHPLEVRFAADKEANRFVLLWKAPGGEWEAVPPQAFGEPNSTP